MSCFLNSVRNSSIFVRRRWAQTLRFCLADPFQPVLLPPSLPTPSFLFVGLALDGEY